MFRFTIRELLLITAVAALGIGWGLRERQLRAKIDDTKCQANVLEYALKETGTIVEWNDERTMVTLYRRDEPKYGRALYVPAFKSGPHPAN
jgi:hypothetical protein